MTYVENIYICMAAPIFIAVLCLKGIRKDYILFLLGGISACFFSSYITSYIAALMSASSLSASMEIAPFVEELLKFSPLLFYLLVLDPPIQTIMERVIMIGVGFATFENVIYLINNGSSNLAHLLIRGFGTGAMHVVCGALLSVGIIRMWSRKWLRIPGTIGLLAVTITYHGIYNVLVSQTGIPAYIGYFIPIVSTILVLLLRGSIRRRLDKTSKNR